MRCIYLMVIFLTIKQKKMVTKWFVEDDIAIDVEVRMLFNRICIYDEIHVLDMDTNCHDYHKPKCAQYREK